MTLLFQASSPVGVPPAQRRLSQNVEHRTSVCHALEEAAAKYAHALTQHSYPPKQLPCYCLRRSLPASPAARSRCLCPHRRRHCCESDSKYPNLLSQYAFDMRTPANTTAHLSVSGLCLTVSQSRPDSASWRPSPHLLPSSLAPPNSL